MRTRLLLTTISPSRAAAPSLGATRKSTSREPCADVGARPEIQFADVVTSHAHSGCVVTENLLAPPVASSIGGDVNDTWHLTTSGPVCSTVEEVPQLAANTATHRRASVARGTLRRTQATCNPRLSMIAVSPDRACRQIARSPTPPEQLAFRRSLYRGSHERRTQIHPIARDADGFDPVIRYRRVRVQSLVRL